MASLYREVQPQKQPYYDKKSGLSPAEWKRQLEISKTLYVGNLSFYTREEQIWELFSKCGNVVKITMGLNKFKKQPCGFCFLEYRTHEQALAGKQILAGSVLDGRPINVDLDAGFMEGRQFGRAESGGQWRDDFRQGFDKQRGGEGGNLLKKVIGVDNGTHASIYTGEQKNSHGKIEVDAGSKKRKDQNSSAQSNPKRKK